MHHLCPTAQGGCEGPRGASRDTGALGPHNGPLGHVPSFHSSSCGCRASCLGQAVGHTTATRRTLFMPQRDVSVPRPTSACWAAPPAPLGHTQGHRLLWPWLHHPPEHRVPRPLPGCARLRTQAPGAPAALELVHGVSQLRLGKRTAGAGCRGGGAPCPRTSIYPPRLPQSLFERQGLPGPEKLPGSLRKVIPRTKSVGTAGPGAACGRGHGAGAGAGLGLEGPLGPPSAGFPVFHLNPALLG